MVTPQAKTSGRGGIARSPAGVDGIGVGLAPMLEEAEAVGWCEVLGLALFANPVWVKEGLDRSRDVPRRLDRVVHISTTDLNEASAL